MSVLLDPFAYGYMTSAMLVSALVGAVCAFLSCFLMLKGWSLIGDALSHSVVPGVAGAYLLGLPLAVGAFISGGLAAASMLFLSERSGLKVDVVIGLIFTAFFGLGLGHHRCLSTVVQPNRSLHSRSFGILAFVAFFFRSPLGALLTGLPFESATLLLSIALLLGRPLLARPAPAPERDCPSSPCSRSSSR